MTQHSEGFLRGAGLREQERDAFHEMMRVLCEERRSAMVVCDREDELDAIGLQLARALRQMPQLQVELFLPSNSESLLDRFNGMVAALPIQAARSALACGDRTRLWVLHLTLAQELPQVQLLLRLVQSFPGAGVRLLLLFSQAAAAQHSVAVLGSRLHRWTVGPVSDRPSPAASAASGGRALASASASAAASAHTVDHTVDHTATSTATHTATHTARAPSVRPVSSGKAEPRPRSSPPVGAASVTVLRSKAQGLIQHARRKWLRVLDRMKSIRLNGPVPGPWRKGLALGLGGVVVSVTGALGAWWMARWDPAQGPRAVGASPSKPVPEMVEFIEGRHRGVQHEGLR